VKRIEDEIAAVRIAMLTDGVEDFISGKGKRVNRDRIAVLKPERDCSL
jgi:hypothetical protein